MIIDVDIIFENAEVNSDFLAQLKAERGGLLLKFSKYKLSNCKFVNLIHKKKYFVLSYVILNVDHLVEKMLKEIKWCSENFEGNFAVKYTIKKKGRVGDNLIIAFEYEQDKILFLLRSEIGNANENW